MKKLKTYRIPSILYLTMIASLGLALGIPWSTNKHVSAAGSEIAPPTDSYDRLVPVEQSNINITNGGIRAPVSELSPQVTICYVSKDGDNSAPTEGFDTGFKYLWDAIAFVGLSGGGEIWVAAGVYYPDEGGTPTNNDPSSTFYLVDSLVIYGGFDTGDAKLSDRDWEKNVTVLSGDIDKNDIKDSNGVVSDPSKIKGNNAYHVVTAVSGNVHSTLDGFTITAGQANASVDPDRYGGGFYCEGSGEGMVCSPDLRNIIFSGNTATNGGAIYNNGDDKGDSSPIMTNINFSGNSAKNNGGAMFNDGFNNGTSSPSLLNVTFTGNSAGNRGGAIYNNGTGGTSSPYLLNVVFSGNLADQRGGAVFNDGVFDGTSSPDLLNVTFSGNYADTYGGGMYNDGFQGTSNPDIRNSIFWNNQDNSGAGTLRANIYNDNASAALAYSLVQGSGASGGSWTSDTSFVDGGDNIDKNPMFVTPIVPSNAPITAGNLRLKTGSPAIDAGDNFFVSGMLTDLDGNPRILDGDGDGTKIVDMGAYETPIYYYLPLIKR